MMNRKVFFQLAIDEFISQCALKGWLVNRINVENRLDVYNIAEEEIEFE